MAVRYFSTTGAGAADGTSWADRAALFSAGTWSTIITGWDFSADSLTCLIGPGTYTCTQSLTITTITTDPTAANPIVLSGCDSSGAALEPSNPTWTAAEPVNWDSPLPVIATTTNILTVSLVSATCHLRMLKFTASGRTSGAVVNAHLDWVVVENSTSNTGAGGVTAGPVYNSAITLSGTAFDYITLFSSNAPLSNARLRATGGASSGNRRGIVLGNFITLFPVRCLVTGCAGGALVSTSTQTNQLGFAVSCVFADNGGSGFLGSTTASQTGSYHFDRCVFTGNGAPGVNAEASNVWVTRSRLRDNASGDFSNFENIPTDIDNDVSDGFANQAAADAAEYMDAGAGDYRIKPTAAIWGKGYGADAPANFAARARFQIGVM